MAKMEALISSRTAWFDAILLLLLVLIGLGNHPRAQELTQVTLLQPEVVRAGHYARLQCIFKGNDVDVQYIAWTKLAPGGARMLVYEYSACPKEDRSYNDLIGRAAGKVIEPIGSNGFAPTLPDDTIPTDDSQSVKLPRDKDTSSVFTSYNGNRSAYIYTAGTDIYHNTMNVGEGTAILKISDVMLKDEGTYECLVKVLDLAPLSDAKLMTVIVIPGQPVLSPVEHSLEEGQNISLTCTANLGRPVGEIIWSRQRKDDSNYQVIPTSHVTTTLMHHGNGTSSAVSSLRLHLLAEDDGAKYRCQTASRVMHSWERTLSAEVTLNLKYGPQKGKILFDATTGRYYCHVKSKPAANYVWVWVQEDGTNKVLSATRYLDLSSINSNGFLQFRCLASNVIGDHRRTHVMDTKLRVLGKHSHGSSSSRSTTATPDSATTKYPWSKADHHVPVFNIELTGHQPVVNSYPYDASSHTSHSISGVKGHEHDFKGYKQLAEAATTGTTSTTVGPAATTTTTPVPTTTTEVTTTAAEIRAAVTPRRNQARSGGGRSRGRGGGGGIGDYEYDEIVEYLYEEDLPKLPRRRPNQKYPNSRRRSNVQKSGFGANRFRQRPRPARGTLPVTARTLTKKLGLGNNEQINTLQALRMLGKLGLVDNGQTKTNPALRRPGKLRLGDNGQTKTTNQGARRRGKLLPGFYAKEGKTNAIDDTLDPYSYQDVQTFKYNEVPDLTFKEAPAEPESFEDVSPATPGEYSCRKKKDGVYGGGCRAFYRCSLGHAFYVECRMPYVYNERTSACDKPEFAPSPCGDFQDCSGRLNGKYADVPRGCLAYYTCHDGQFLGHNKCQTGLIFSEEKQLCDWPENVAPPCGKRTDDKSVNLGHFAG